MKKKAILGLIFTLLTFALLLIPSKEMSFAIENAVVFCGKIVIPQLFLYICLSSLVWEIGIIESIISAFPKYGAELSAFLMGILSGFPSGAIISGKLYEKKLITKNRAEYLSTFSNNAGISFIFGYLSTIIGKTGALSVFICQIIFSLIFALSGRVFLSEEDKKVVNALNTTTVSTASVINAIKNATHNTINICGFILFFSAFSSLICNSLPLVFSGILEMTTGLSLLSPLPFQEKLRFSSLFVGFGGLCVHFQVFAVCPVGTKKFIFSKCVSALFFPIAVYFIHNAISSFVGF